MDLGRTYLGETFGERDDLTASDFLLERDGEDLPMMTTCI